MGIGRLIGSPSTIGEAALPAALSKPFLLKINRMIGHCNIVAFGAARGLRRSIEMRELDVTAKMIH